MIIHNPILTGSFTFNGTDVSSVTGSSTYSASFASSLNSLNAATASLNTFSASMLSFTASQNALNATFATTGSNTFVGNQVITGSLNVTGSITTPGTLTAQTLVVQTITSSVDFVTGSTRFGSISGNTHQFTGSMSVNGSVTFTGGISSSVLTLNTTTADYAATITNVQDSSQGLLVRATDNDTTLYLLNLQSSAGATSQTWIDRFAVTKGGFVGIGTNNPSVLLHVTGGNDYNTMFSSTSNRSGWVINTPGTNSPAGSGLVLASDGSFRLGNATQYQIAMYTNNEVGIYGGGSERLRVTNSGSVGIGTTSPSSRLGVKATGADGIVLEQDSGDPNNSGRLFFTGSVQTFGLFNNAGDWRFTYAAQPGNTSGTSLARFTNTGKYFRMESGTGGIQFQGTTSAANALNFYEEGTWTPSLVGGGGQASYGANRAGWYTRIGRVVTISWFVSFSKNTLGSTLQLSGLPFTLINGSGIYYPQGPTLMDYLATTTNNITLQGANNSSVGDFIYGNGGTGQHTGLPISVLGSGTMECRGTLTYFTS